MKTTIVETRVHIDCPGCKRKIIKSLSKLDGVDTVDVDVAMQKMTVTGWADQQKALKTVRKGTGRKAELWPFPYNPECHDYYARYHGTDGSPNYYLHSDHHRYSSQITAIYFAAQPAPLSTYNSLCTGTMEMNTDTISSRRTQQSWMKILPPCLVMIMPRYAL